MSVLAPRVGKALSRSFTSRAVDGFVGAVGNTPLVRPLTQQPPLISRPPLTLVSKQIHLKKWSERTGCTIVGKAEFQNPGGSVKDRAALGVIRDAEQRGVYV